MRLEGASDMEQEKNNCQESSLAAGEDNHNGALENQMRVALAKTGIPEYICIDIVRT